MDNTVTIAPPVLNGHTTPEPDIIVLKFADSSIPVFKETRGSEYISYGEDNKYAEYLTYLFNKCANHNAIVTGKSDYIFGEGFENGEMDINRLGESLNDISKRAILDTRIYGGFFLEVIYNRVGKISEIYHVDFTSLRVAKDGGFYYKECWDKFNHDEKQLIPAFNPAMPYGSQIYAYFEYRPMVRYYPLPDYIGCNNYIETDIEISKYYLSSIRNGMNPSKMIQFFKGEPTEDKKRAIERRMASKFSGAENAGNFLLVFNDANASKSVEINDLSGSDLDKMFVEMNKICQQQIFSGHKVTSPMLFGIKTEGQLGGTNELRTAYDIFRNTYANIKADDYSKEITYLLGFSVWPDQYDLLPTDPIGLQFDVKDVINSIPKTFVFKALGIPEAEWNNPSVGGGVQGPVNVAAPTLDSDVKVNTHIKNLTAKQHQEMMRIVRQYQKGLSLPGASGTLTESAARVLLRTGLGFTDEEINDLLDIKVQPVALSAETVDEIIAMFDSCGDSKNDYEIIKSKRVSFSLEEIEEDELIFIEAAFKTFDVTYTESKIIDLIKSDKRITPEIIAKAIGESKAFVESKIASLTKKGYLESTIEKIGQDEIIERTVPKGLDINTPPPRKDAVKISIKYSYEPKPGLEPIIPTTRPFCRKLIGLNRIYSRAEIEKISARLGYSVFERKGGWWGNNPECRHRWVSNIVVQKKEVPA